MIGKSTVGLFGIGCIAAIDITCNTSFWVEACERAAASCEDEIGDVTELTRMDDRPVDAELSAFEVTMVEGMTNVPGVAEHDAAAEVTVG